MLNVRLRRLLSLALATCIVVVPARISSAQNAAAPTSAAAQADDDDDAVLDPIEPDFRVVDLPTTARLPRGKGNSPRLSGYKPGSNQFGFAMEKRAGGHMFQLNFTNTFGTTFAQIARGASPRSLSLGFNLSRKFY